MPDCLRSDDFGVGGSINDIPGWDEQGNDSDASTLAMQPSSGNDSASPDGGRFAFIDRDEWICREVDADGYHNLMLQYYWRGDTSSEASDDLIVEVRDNGSCGTNENGNGWTTLQTHDMNNSSWTQRTAFELPASFDNSTFFLRFRVDSSEDIEDARLDAVSMTADEMPPVCDGQSATVYVNSSNVIVGGPMNGLTYNGILVGTSGVDTIVGTNGADYVDAMGGQRQRLRAWR